MAEILALLSSLLVGSSDFLAGRLGKQISVFAIIACASGVAALVFLGLGFATGSIVFDSRDVRTGFVTGLCLLGGNSLYFAALARGTMGVVGGIVGTLVIVPVLVSLLYGVSLSTLTLVGVVVTVGSAVLLGAPEMKGGTATSAVLFAALAALLFGFSEVTMDVGSANNLYGALFVMELTAAVIAAAVAFFTKSLGGINRQTAPTLGAVGVLSAGSWAAFSEATIVGDLAEVAVLSSLGPVVITLLAFFFLKQKLQSIQLVALFGVLVGSMLVTGGQ